MSQMRKQLQSLREQNEQQLQTINNLTSTVVYLEEQLASAPDEYELYNRWLREQELKKPDYSWIFVVITIIGGGFGLWILYRKMWGAKIFSLH